MQEQMSLQAALMASHQVTQEGLYQQSELVSQALEERDAEIARLRVPSY